MRHIEKIILPVILAMALQPTALGAGPDHEDYTEAVSGDVFVIVDSSLRNPTSETAADEPLYSNAGTALDVTWGEWTSASGTSATLEIGGSAQRRTDVRIQVEGLVSNGVYSVFFVTLGPDSRHPVCSDLDRLVPLTSLHGPRQEPDASSFVADLTGRGAFHGRVDGSLLAAEFVGFFLIYHFDGQSYHPYANAGQALSECGRNSYGEDAMRHLFVIQKGTAG